MKASKSAFLIVSLCVAFYMQTAHAQPPMFNKCQMCHGKMLQGKKKNPAIVGMSYEKILASLTSEVPKKMKGISNKLTEAQKIELSRYISKLEEKNESR